MKRLFAFLIPFVFIFSSCIDPTRNIDYCIKNTTSYDITVIDTAYLNKPEYLIKANSFITLEHPSSGKFEIKNTSFPVEIKNTYNYSEIKELHYFELPIYNNSNKDFVLKIINSTFPPETYNITQSETILKIYSNELVIKLFYNNTDYNNFILKNDSLVIF